MTPRKTERPNHMTPTERDDCVRLYLTGATLDRLAEIFDRERCTIGRLVASRGVKRSRFQQLTYYKNAVEYLN